MQCWQKIPSLPSSISSPSCLWNTSTIYIVVVERKLRRILLIIYIYSIQLNEASTVIVQFLLCSLGCRWCLSVMPRILSCAQRFEFLGYESYVHHQRKAFEKIYQHRSRCLLLSTKRVQSRAKINYVTREIILVLCEHYEALLHAEATHCCSRQ